MSEINEFSDFSGGNPVAFVCFRISSDWNSTHGFSSRLTALQRIRENADGRQAFGFWRIKERVS